MAECEKCGGREVIDVDGKLHECICSFLKRISASMPPYIRKADILPEHLEHPIMKAVGMSVYVVAAWADMKAIIKAVMIKNPSKFVRISSDAEIRDVFVGSKSKAAKSAGFEGDVYNNLSDLMDPPDLMVIRLNEISYKNKAAAGALEEALSYRLDREKPTWVLSNLDKRFVSGSFAYSESVAELLATGYKRTSVKQIAKPLALDDGLFAEPTSSNFGDDLSDSMQMEEPQVMDSDEGQENTKKKQRKVVQEQKEDDETPEGPLARYGQGLGNRYGKSGFGRGK